MLKGLNNGDHWPDKNVLWARRWTLIHCSGRAVLRGRNWNLFTLAVNVSTSIGITLQAMLAQACVSQLSSARDHLETGILSGSVMPPTSWRTASWSTRSTRYYLEVHVKYQVIPKYMSKDQVLTGVSGNTRSLALSVIPGHLGGRRRSRRGQF